MNRLFGKGKQTEIPTMDDAIKGMEGRESHLTKKIEALDKQLAGYKQQMSKMREGPSKNNIKQKALRLLKQKRMYENQRDTTQNQVFNMETTNFNLQQSKDIQLNVKIMQNAQKAMRKEAKKINVDKIHDLYDDMQDQFDDMNEINEVMGRQYEGLDMVDDADLEAEFDALGDELFDEDVNVDDSLPNVPTSNISNNTNPTTNNGIECDEFGLPLQN